HVTPLFPNMLAPAVVDEGEGSKQPTEPQTTPSPTTRPPVRPKIFVLPLWSSYTSTVKSFEAKNRCEKPNGDTGSKTHEEPVDQEDQAFLGELERLKRQERRLMMQMKLLENGVLLNFRYASPSRVFSAGGPSYPDLTNNDQDDSQIPAEGAVADFTNLETTVNVSSIPTSRIHSIHPTTQILGDPTLAVQTRSKVNKSSGAYAFIEPKKISQALEDESWVDVMQEELLQFNIQKVWILVDLSFGKKAIRTKWVYRNKKDERGVVVINNARIEAIRIFLAFASYMGFIIYQMDVKSAFLYGTIDEEVYVSQPPGFVDPKFSKKVYKVVKALYGLHQAPRAWFFVDDIIFGSTMISWCDELWPLMKRDFLLSSMGRAPSFLGLQFKQKEMDEEAADVDVHLYRSMIGSLMYLKGKPKLGLWYLRVSSFDLEAYSNSDYAGANLDRKSTTGGCQFLSRRLISWQCKKQTIMATSTTEAEYVAATNCCGQNPIIHSKTKHIEIRHHFIRDAYEKKLIQHKMVAYLEKTEGNAQFHKIVDFLSRSSIFYALTTVLISELLNWKDDLLFNDDNGIDCLIVAYIYENLPLMGNLEAKKKFLIYPRYVQVFLNNQLQNIPAPLDNLLIPVLSKKVFTNMTRRGLYFSGHVTPLFPTMLVPAAVEEGEGSGTHTEPQPTPSPTQPSVGDQTHVTKSSYRPANTQNTRNTLEGTGGSEGDQVRVLALETSKDAQAAENLKLKTRIKKLEKKCKPNISHYKAWLRSVSILSMKKKLGKKEFVSKQGRKNAKPVPTLDNSAFDNLDADLAHGMDIKEAVNEGRQIKETKELNVTHNTKVLEKRGSNEEPVNATGNIGVSIVVPKDDKAKLKGVAIKEVEESDRHKGVLEEEPEPAKKLKKSDLDAAQLAMDEEVARQVNAELQAELERERVAAEEATQAVITSEFDEIQARMNADTLLAERLQEAEREQFTIEQRAKFLHDTIAAQRKFLA
ncbi:putative ribonuclease H-like domain-containing protein, partial [Tanacetum coccineum]